MVRGLRENGRVTLPPLKPVGEQDPAGALSLPSRACCETAGRPAPRCSAARRRARTAVGTWQLVTGTEPADAKGDQVSSLAVVKSVVERSQLAKLRNALAELGAGLLTDQLPPIIRGYLHDALVGAAKSATDGFVKLLNASGWTAVEVTYHDPGKKPKGHREVWDGSWSSSRLPDPRAPSTSTSFVSVASMAGSLSVAGSPCVSAGLVTRRGDGPSGRVRPGRGREGGDHLHGNDAGRHGVRNLMRPGLIVAVTLAPGRRLCGDCGRPTWGHVTGCGGRRPPAWSRPCRLRTPTPARRSRAA